MACCHHPPSQDFFNFFTQAELFVCWCLIFIPFRGVGQFPLRRKSTLALFSTPFVCIIIFLLNQSQNFLFRCLPEKTCCPAKNQKPIWEIWYVWFGVALIFLFLITSIGTYFVSLCKKKQQNLIRIRNLSPTSGSSAVIATISGPGGIIQPDIRRLTNQANAHTTVAIAETSTKDKINSLAEPLSPPYPPVEPVKIIKGSAPPEGFRQTDSYTEIVLPPGYIDSEHYKP